MLSYVLEWFKSPPSQRKHITFFVKILGLNNISVRVDFFVLVYVSFFITNISLHMQTMLVLVSVVHFCFKKR
jgi:hypothetical protein